MSQVSFEVSPAQNQVTAKFSNGALIKALEQGEVRPNEMLKVYVALRQPQDIDEGTSIIGTYGAGPGQVVFQPLVPFSEELPYLAVFGDSLEYRFQLATPVNRPITRLLNVYPTIDTVPANLLKIYLEFSAPMREGEVYQRVRLYNQQGDPVKDPFVRLHPELWDTSGQMVTLWLDPGRVKRALLSREAHGPVLEAGKNYRLEVDAQWKDTHGQALDRGFTKIFKVSPDDRQQPNTGSWLITPPAAGTRDPLLVAFGSTLDYGTIRKAFAIYSHSGNAVAGSITVSNQQDSIAFVPEHDWLSGSYQIKVDAILEDLAGNNLNRLFDRDLTKDKSSPHEQQHYTVDFRISR